MLGTRRVLPAAPFSSYNIIMPKTSSQMKHAQLVARAADWLRHKYGCGIVLSEQYCVTGEVPDVIGMESVLPVGAGGVQSVAQRFSGGREQAIPLTARKTRWEASGSTWRLPA